MIQMSSKDLYQIKTEEPVREKPECRTELDLWLKKLYQDTKPKEDMPYDTWHI